MSALGHKRDILRCESDVRFTPKSGHVQCTSDVRFVPKANSCTAANSIAIRSLHRRALLACWGR